MNNIPKITDKRILYLLISILILSAVTVSSAFSEDCCQDSDSWRKRYIWCKNTGKEQSRKLFEMAEYINTVRAYEMYLTSKNVQPELATLAKKRIFELAGQADLIEGYQYVLKKYPEMEKEAKTAYKRLCAIYYKIAEKQNTFQSYCAFLSLFETVPEDFREKSIACLVSLEEDRIMKELNTVPETSAAERQLAVEKCGRRLYQEAADAKNRGDYITFEWKYNTLLKCSIFEESEVRFDLQRDKELLKKLDEIQTQIKELDKNFQKSLRIFSSKIENLIKSTEEKSEYALHVRLVQDMQNRNINSQLPVIWDKDKDVWKNFVNIGILCLKAWKSPEQIILNHLPD